jgi:hypothetical protein
MKTSLLWAMVLLIALAGCNQPQSGWGVREISRDATTVNGANIAGIDKYHIFVGTFGDKAAVALWCDDPLYDFAAMKKPDGIYYVGFKTDSSHRPFFACTTRDGTTGTVTIAGKQLSLDEGPTFLVRHRDGEVEVQALQQTLPPQLTDEQAEELSQSDATIREFFTR